MWEMVSRELHRRVAGHPDIPAAAAAAAAGSAVLYILGLESGRNDVVYYYFGVRDGGA